MRESGKWEVVGECQSEQRFIIFFVIYIQTKYGLDKVLYGQADI